MSELVNLIDFIRKEFNKSLKTFSIPKDPKYLYGPIKYSLKSKGKRFRPIIVHLSGRNFKCDPDDLMKVSLGLELLHNFTLVHDDIMDSDDTRRNMPTVHKKYDIPSAILAGDGIFTISQLILGTIQNNSNHLLQKYNEMVLEICEGQALDKQFEGEDKLNLDDYIEMVKKKTGALLGACLSLPAIISNENSEKVKDKNTPGYQMSENEVLDNVSEVDWSKIYFKPDRAKIIYKSKIYRDFFRQVLGKGILLISPLWRSRNRHSFDWALSRRTRVL